MIAALFIFAPDLATLFTHEADVRVSKPGLQRLLLNGDVLSKCRADLSDLRLLGDAEIPFVIVDSETEKTETIHPETRTVKRDADKEQFDLVFNAPIDGEWDLVLTTSRGRFVKQIDVFDGDKHVTASVFRLPDMGRERVRVPLVLNGAHRLVVSITGDGAYLEPAAAITRGTRFGAHHSLEMRVDGKLSHANKHTFIDVPRPKGVVPSAITIAAEDALFDRLVRVYNDDELVAQGRIFNLDQTLPMSAKRAGKMLRVDIEDKDSPPLRNVTLTLRVEQPALVFAATRDARMLLGGGRAALPDYDISGMQLDANTIAHASPAELTKTRENPRFDRAPFLRFAMRAGANVDARAFAWRGKLSVTSAEGLSRVKLSVEDVARARPDLADVRIVDKQSRQWPYLLVRDGRVEQREVSVVDGRVDLPGRVRAERLTLVAPEPFIRRPYTLKDSGRVVAQGTLKQDANDDRPLSIDLAGREVSALTLDIHNGNDAPLRINSALIDARLPDLYLVAPVGEYFLLFGYAEAVAPVYELESIRSLVLAVPADDAFADAAPNPDYNEMTKPIPMHLAMWVVIVLAVLALGILTLRLAKNE